MVIFQCSLCGETAKAVPKLIPYSYEHGKDKNAVFNMPTYAFSITPPDYWECIMVDKQVVVMCPFCPKKVS